MSYPFSIFSDAHCHNWSQFSSVNSDGLNTRLVDILNEIKSAAANVKARGGDTLYCAGDLFHIRGSVSPDVLNPLIDVIEELGLDGIKLRILTGNHDLKSRDSEALSSACEALRTLANVEVVSKPTIFWDDKVAMVPWYDAVDDIRKNIHVLKDGLEDGTVDSSMPAQDISEWTLIIHAPVNGVLVGIPDHGFWAKELEVLGFKYVFSGHYHAHKQFPGNVFSVGATTHQTWNDVGTLAGHLIVNDTGVEHIESKAPKFLDYDLTWDAGAASEAVDGNFVRVVMGAATEEDVDFIRETIMDFGAKGVVVNAIPVPKGTVTTRSAPVAAAVITTRDSIKQWIDTNAAGKDPAFIAKAQSRATAIMNEVEAVTV